jgi:L-serine deaminase
MDGGSHFRALKSHAADSGRRSSSAHWENNLAMSVSSWVEEITMNSNMETANGGVFHMGGL